MWVGVCEAVSCQKLSLFIFTFTFSWIDVGWCVWCCLLSEALQMGFSALSLLAFSGSQAPHTIYIPWRENPSTFFASSRTFIALSISEAGPDEIVLKIESFFQLLLWKREWAIEVDDERNQTLGINQIIFSKSPNDIKNLPVAPTFGSIVPNLSMTFWPMVEIQAKIVRWENPSIFPPSTVSWVWEEIYLSLNSNYSSRALLTYIRVRSIHIILLLYFYIILLYYFLKSPRRLTLEYI